MKSLMTSSPDGICAFPPYQVNGLIGPRARQGLGMRVCPIVPGYLHFRPLLAAANSGRASPMALSISTRTLAITVTNMRSFRFFIFNGPRV